jgi:tetratricopeptide (TPR) repeat protein
MLKSVLKNYRFGLLLVCLLLTPVYVSGQDLGSGSGLFNKKSSTKKKTPKKNTPARKKPAPTRKPAPVRSAATRKKTTPASSRKKTGETAAARNSENNRTKTNQTAKTGRTPQDDIVINVGDPTSGDFAELFEQAIAEGNQARNLREYIRAEDAYSRAKSINPKDSRAIYGLGNIYSDQQRWEEAEQAYRQAILIEPENPSAHIAISFVLTQPVVGSNLGKRYEEAEKTARKAIELDPANAIGYDQLGVALELRGLIGNETKNAYEKAIELEPGFALAYAHLGRLLRRNGEMKESSAAYRQAIQLSKDVPTMILVADVMQSQQRYTESEQLLRTALRQDPKNPTALFLLGRALTVRKSFDEAEAVLNKSVAVSPNSFVSYTLLGSLYYSSGKLEQAEQALNKALSVISENEKKRLAQEFEEVGDRYLKVNKFEEARRVYQKAKDLDKTKESLTLKLAQVQSSR